MFALMKEPCCSDEGMEVANLIQSGADVNIADNNGTTALHKAAYNGHVNCVNALIAAGADVNQDDRGRTTPLMAAAKSASAECIIALLRAGADVNKKDESTMTCLHHAVIEGCTKCVNLLIDAGADVNPTEMAALSLASFMANVHISWARFQCVKILVKAGARVNIQDEWKNGPYFEPTLVSSDEIDYDISMLLYSAGEITDNADEQDTVKDELKRLQEDKTLKNQCRQAIRRHLLELDPYTNLFIRIPQLGLPPPLTRYLLYYMELDY